MAITLTQSDIDEIAIAFDRNGTANNVEIREALDKVLVDLTASNVNYTSYTAVLTQTSTNAPTDVVIDGTITISWAYIAAGTYTGTVTGATLAIAKTVCFAGGGDLGDMINIRRTADTTVQVTTLYNNSVSGDNGILISTPVEIRVYD